MVTVHFGPLPVRESGVTAWIYASFYGKASVLFVVIAGLGVALMARDQSRREVRARLVYRTVWLLPLGLALQELDHPVAVILQYYALYFLFLAPFVGRRDATLVGWAGGLLAVGSAAVLAAEVLVPDWVVPLRGDSPFGVPGDLVLFGYYPLVTWLPPMLVGLWLGRRDLTRGRLRWGLVGAGAAALAVTTALGSWLSAVLGVARTERTWGWLLSTAGHSEMPLAVVGATGFAVGVIGIALVVADRWPRLLWPLTAFGRVALSVYVGHLIVFAAVPGLFPADDVAEGVRTIAAFAGVTSVLAMAWLALMPRGPLETAVRWPWQHVVRPLVLGANGDDHDRAAAHQRGRTNTPERVLGTK